MHGLPLIGFGSFVLASAVVGLRLLRIALRTGQTPEFAIGTALFAGGGVGYGLVVLAFAAQAFPLSVVPIAVLGGTLCASFGAVALAFGVWRIFRPRQRWPLAVVGGIAAVLALSLAARVAQLAQVPASTPVFWSFTAGSAAAYLWSAIESLRFHALMRRRLRIGLGDPAIAARFLLWGVSACAALGIHLCSAINRHLDPSTLPAALVGIQSGFGLVAAAGIWLAFFPPRRWRSAPPAA